MKNNRKIKELNDAGYTLVEIMVVMVITYIVFGGVYKAITDESIDLDKQEIVLDMQLNARAVLDVIAKDIRKVGFLGCSGDESANTVLSTGVTDPIQLYTNNGGADLPILNRLKTTANVDYFGAPLAYVNNVAGGHITYESGTDVLTVRYMSGDIPLATAMVTSTTTPIQVGANSFSEGDILYITDCENYSIFQKTDCDSSTSIQYGNVDNCLATAGLPTPFNVGGPDLGEPYGLNSRLYNLVVNTYFLRNGLLTMSRNNVGDDIATNIEDLQFQYKWDSNNNNDLSDEVWLDDPFTGGAAAEDIRAIKIFVLTRSDTVFSYTDTNTYDYPNSPFYSAANPFGSANGAGGSPASQAPMAGNGENRYRYLASAVINLRNSDL